MAVLVGFILGFALLFSVFMATAALVALWPVLLAVVFWLVVREERLRREAAVAKEE